MKVVVDTNVLISGLLGGANAPALILDRWLNSRFELAFTMWLRDELLRVLSYPHVVRATKRPLDEIDTLRTLIMATAVRDVEPAGYSRDPDDRHVVGAAVGLGADAIVTGDKDLLVLEQFQGIPILTPRQFLTLLDDAGANSS